MGGGEQAPAPELRGRCDPWGRGWGKQRLPCAVHLEPELSLVPRSSWSSSRARGNITPSKRSRSRRC